LIVAKFEAEGQRRSKKRILAVWGVAAMEGRSKREGDRERRERRGKMENFLSRLQRGVSRRHGHDEQHHQQQSANSNGQEIVEERNVRVAEAAEVADASEDGQRLVGGGEETGLGEEECTDVVSNSQSKECDFGDTSESFNRLDRASIPSEAAGQDPSADEVVSIGASAGKCHDASIRGEVGDGNGGVSREAGACRVAGTFSAFIAPPGVRADGTRIRPTSATAAATAAAASSSSSRAASSRGRGTAVARNEGGGGEACAIEVPECPMVVAMKERERVRKERRQALNEKYEAKRRAKEEEEAARLAKEEEVIPP